jgi:hypothetical protein
MLEISIHLLYLVYPDSFYSQDKVSRAAGRCSVGSVSCSTLRKCTVTSKLRFHYRDSYVIGFYRDGATCVHLPGPDSYQEAKNSPTLILTATTSTTLPLHTSAENRNLMGNRIICILAEIFDT